MKNLESLSRNNPAYSNVALLRTLN